jgi:hypothetical protein
VLTLLTHTHAICMRRYATLEGVTLPPTGFRKTDAGGVHRASGQRSRCDKLWYSAVLVAGYSKLSCLAPLVTYIFCVGRGSWIHWEGSGKVGWYGQCIRVGM